MSGSSGGENLDLMAKVDIAEWSLVQRMSSATRLRLAKLLRAFISVMNARNERVKVRPITLSELVDHYRQQELKPDTLWCEFGNSDPPNPEILSHQYSHKR